MAKKQPLELMFLPVESMVLLRNPEYRESDRFTLAAMINLAENPDDIYAQKLVTSSMRRAAEDHYLQSRFEANIYQPPPVKGRSQFNPPQHRNYFESFYSI